jgi:hypothetical protein
MAGLFEGIAPPNVETTRTTEQKAPGFLTDYLTNLAKAGSEALGTTTTDASGKTVFTPKTGADLIAPMSDLQKSAYDKAGGLLSQYRTPLDEALAAGRSAMEVSADDISKFYDPYQQEVIDKMREASDVNLQRSVLPGLKAIGIGSGQFGGRRAGVLGGQALGDLAAALSREESGLRSAGFKTALDAALREQGQQTGAANALTNLGQTEFQAGLGEAKGLAELGAQQTAYDQSKIDAPLTRAANVAQLLRGYSFPTTTTETYSGPASVYGPSPLSQIAGLGSLIGAAFPAGGQGAGSQAIKAIKDFLSNQQLSSTMDELTAIGRESTGGTMDSQELDDFLNSILGPG